MPTLPAGIKAVAIDSIFIGTIKPLGCEQTPSAIRKRPCAASLAVNTLGLIGDQQADRRIHGGPEKALHHYAAENYRRLARQYPQHAARLQPGLSGENISTHGLTEEHIRIGDIFRLGTATVQVSQPRSPCWKIDEHAGIRQLSQYIARHAISGWYYRVLAAGRVQQGDWLTLLESADQNPTLSELWHLYLARRPAQEALETAIAATTLAAEWRHRLASRLHSLPTREEEENSGA